MCAKTFIINQIGKYVFNVLLKSKNIIHQDKLVLRIIYINILIKSFNLYINHENYIYILKIYILTKKLLNM